MTLGELLSQMRDYYLRHFREVLKEQRKEPTARVISEPMLCKADGEVAHEGVLQLPIRADVVLIRNDKVEDSFQVTTERTVSFKPFTFPWTEGAQVTVGPFQWENCAVRLPGVGPESNFKPLASWYTSWFDEDQREGMFYSSDLRGVLHSLSNIDFKEGAATFTIDFGSAPTDVFEYLLDALEQAGAKTIHIGEVEQAGQSERKQESQP